MNREYDIFENCSEGSVWRCSVVGREETMAALTELSKHTANEAFAMFLPNREVIARANVRVTSTEILHEKQNPVPAKRAQD